MFNKLSEVNSLKICEDIYLVGSGAFGISHERDCHVYLIRSGDEAALIDSGSGLDTDQILNNIIETGCDLKSIKYLFLTHAHADHACGVADLRQHINFQVVTSAYEKNLITKGTEYELGLVHAKHKGSYDKDYEYKHSTVDIIVESNETFKLGASNIESIIVPGHSKGSTGFLFDNGKQRSFFAGDIVFVGGLINLLNCPGSDLNDYRMNIGRLGNLQIDSLFSGHHIWTVKDGQKHIDLAIERLKSVSPPPNLS